jgi:hypothetical protein
VGTPQRSAADETLDCFDAERELPKGERSLGSEPALASRSRLSGSVYSGAFAQMDV